jgi:predicted DNA-binding protein
MPSDRKRMALTLPKETEAALDDLADAIGKPASTIAAELLGEMVPQIVGLAKIARATKAGNKAAAKRALVHMVGDNMAELMSMTQPDMFPKKKAK